MSKYLLNPNKLRRELSNKNINKKLLIKKIIKYLKYNLLTQFKAGNLHILSLVSQ